MTFAHFNAEQTLRGMGESLHHFKVATSMHLEIECEYEERRHLNCVLHFIDSRLKVCTLNP